MNKFDNFDVKITINTNHELLPINVEYAETVFDYLSSRGLWAECDNEWLGKYYNGSLGGYAYLEWSKDGNPCKPADVPPRIRNYVETLVYGAIELGKTTMNNYALELVA